MQVNVERVVAVAEDVARGLCYLHKRRIVHGDLKSQNVLLKQSQTNRGGFVAKVADFGISRVIDSRPKHLKDLIGTIAYMPNETIENSVMGSETDVFSFGLLVWELLSGQEAFCQCTTHTHLLQTKRRFDTSTNVDDVWSEVLPMNQEWPDELILLVRDCCEQEVERRPTMEQILTRLRQFSKS
eukprot:TRINITY_DN23746_c0_g1_i1.p1 TRINITY_DN23746_c0_g1~~TRINITY_DN23746_c0_g1_i1.p1  ORF type:complete len:210 (-),score=29.54 TRINITY_DN23746_c0_g1_i1:103-654(-)